MVREAAESGEVRPGMGRWCEPDARQLLEVGNQLSASEAGGSHIQEEGGEEHERIEAVTASLAAEQRSRSRNGSTTANDVG